MSSNKGDAVLGLGCLLLILLPSLYFKGLFYWRLIRFLFARG